MKKVIFAVILIVVFFFIFMFIYTQYNYHFQIQGIELPAPEESDDHIELIGDENFTAIKIKASKVNGEWQFPLKKYEKQFIDVNLHNERFIKLDKNEIKFLEESEAIWLTPMIQNNSGELVNAIYSKEISSCNPSEIKILGKMYPISDLKHGSSFRNDDKWKVLVGKEGNCLKRLVIYMNGYFYNIKEGEQINLFRNDYAVILSFYELKYEPKVRILISKPISLAPIPITDNSTVKTKNKEEQINSSNSYSVGELVIDGYVVGDLSIDKGGAVFCKKHNCQVTRFFVKEGETIRMNNTCLTLQAVRGYAFHGGWINASIFDCKDLERLPDYFIIRSDWERIYKEKETLNENGLFLDFEPGIPICADGNCSKFFENGLSERHRIVLDINNKNWVITKLGKTKVSVGNEKSNAILHPYNCENETIRIGNSKWGLYDHMTDTDTAILSPVNSSEFIRIKAGEQMKIDGTYVNVWRTVPGYIFCAKWAKISTFSEIINITDRMNNITLQWENENSSNPALKSIFIPRSSQIFEKLTKTSDSIPESTILRNGDSVIINGIEYYILSSYDVNVGTGLPFPYNRGVIFCKDSNCTLENRFDIRQGGTKKIDNSCITVNTAVPAYTYDGSWANLSIYNC